MDPDSFKSDKKKKNKNANSHIGDFLQSFGIRRTLCSCDEVDWVLLDNRYNFLFHIGIVFWVVLFIETRK